MQFLKLVQVETFNMEVIYFDMQILVMYQGKILIDKIMWLSMILMVVISNLFLVNTDLNINIGMFAMELDFF
jgi:hypothetical protein